MSSMNEFVPPQRALTDDEITDYVESGGGHCPFEECQSNDIEGYGGFDMDSCQAWQNIRCNDCGRTWTDEYSLSGAQAHEE